MKILTNKNQVRKLVESLGLQKKTIGFVPTLGFLHKGHLSLVRKSKQQNDITIVSIFVNPTQFGKNEDFKKYPRDFNKDKNILKGFADYIFLPNEKEMYGKNEQVQFDFKSIASGLCALSRPTHFQGVALVLAKFFNLIKPNKVYFGQKDYQQTIVVKHLIDELFFDCKLVVEKTVREKSGLALSSRNFYLSENEKKLAANIYKSLQLGKSLYENGEKNPHIIIKKIKTFLLKKEISKIDYVDIRDAKSLQEISKIKRKFVIAVVVFIGKVRLIDNILCT